MKRGFLKKAKTGPTSPILPTPNSRELAADVRAEPPTIPSTTTKSVPQKLSIPIVHNLPDSGMRRCAFRETSQIQVVNLPSPSSPSASSPPVVCVLYPGAKEVVEALPGLTEAYRPSLREKYRIGDAPGAGKGMFATSDLEPGDLILRERPLFLFPMGTSLRVLECGVGAMNPESRAKFFALSNCMPDEISEIYSIVYTNCIIAGPLPGSYDGAYSGVAADLARINHSCSPNAVSRWRLTDMAFEVRAARSIKQGEQIYICYIDQLRPRAERQADLESGYSFTCACFACSLSPAEWNRSDIRRKLLRSTMEADNPFDDATIYAWLEDASLPDDTIEKSCMKFITMMEQEELADSIFTFGQLYYPRLVRSFCALKDRDKARVWAERMAQVMLIHAGEDGGWRLIAQYPERADWWDVRALSLAVLRARRRA